MSNVLLKSNNVQSVCCLESNFALYHALLKLVGFHMSGRCKIHAAMGINQLINKVYFKLDKILDKIQSYCFPDGQACAYRLCVLKSCSTHWSEILDSSY